MLSLIFAVVFSFAAAGPLAGQVDKRADSRFCSAVKKQYCEPTASTYCSSYLSIPLSTTTSATTVAGGTSTVAVTANPESENLTITILSCAPPQTPAAKAKRASKKPACLLKYTARAQISSACSCLSLKPSTRTVSSTVNGAGSTQTTTFTPTITNTNYELEPAATAAFNIAARGGGVIGGSYATTDTNYPQFNSYQSSATTFRLLGNRLVATDGTYADDPYFLGITIVDEDPAPMRRVVLDLNAHSLSCRIVYDMLGCYIECNTGQTGYTYNYDCGNWYWLKANDFTTQCSGFRPYAVST